MKSILEITSPINSLAAMLCSLVAAIILTPADARAQGALTNGWTYQGNIAVPGQADTWTFNANKGDAIVLRVGEIFNTAFSPQIQLLNPTNGSVLLTSGASAAEIAVTATTNGTYTVIISDNANTHTNAYRLTLAKTGDPVVIAPGEEGGPMTNGFMHTGTIDVGGLDVWTFTATAGQALVVRMGQTVATNTLTPQVRLYAPNGAPLGNNSFASAAEVTATATTNGTYLVVASDFSSGYIGSGGYRLTLAKTGDPVVIAPGEEGGPMTNAFMHTGTIEVGGLDVWTFTATAGQALVVRMGQTVPTDTLTPEVRLYAPNGASLGDNSFASAAEVAATATTTGTYLVVVDDFSSGYGGSGGYRLTLAKTGDPVVIAPGEEGGPMTNGFMHTGTIEVGSLDVWTFTATAGQALIVRMGRTVATNTLTPDVRVYAPNGALLGNVSFTTAAEVAATATGSGTYLVVANDFSSGYGGSGDYRLTLAKTGDPVVIAPGEEGGPMTNGFMHTGNIEVGALDVWTFTANTGDALVVRMGRAVATNTLTPDVRVYAPNGTLVGNLSYPTAAEVAATATGSGTYLVVATDFSSGYGGSGGYRLTLAKTGSPVVTAAGDEGGPLTGAGIYNGAIDVGDLDVWTFTACAGDTISLQMQALTGSPFTPWIRLYGRDGTLLNTIAGTPSVQVVRSAPATGNYLLVLTDDSSAYAGSGTYQLTVNKLTDGLKECTPILAGTNVLLSEVGGQSGATFVLYSATNVTTPLASWNPIATNLFDGFGTFTITNAINTNIPQQYFILKLP